MAAIRRRKFFLQSTFFGVSILCGFFILGCASDSGDVDTEPPPAPTFLLKSCVDALDSFPERGTDAMPGGDGIKFEWEIDPRPDDLAGFYIYRAVGHPDSGFVELEEDAERFLEGNPETFQFIDRDGELRASSFWGSRAWYYVRAVDIDGNIGAVSDTTSYRLWASPRLLPSGVEVLHDTLHVQWQFEFVDHFVYGFQGFQLLVADPLGTELQFMTEFREGLEPQMQASISMAEMNLDEGDWRIRIDTIVGFSEQDSLGLNLLRNEGNCNHSGSESPWISFTY